MCTHSRQMNVMGEHTVMHRAGKYAIKLVQNDQVEKILFIQEWDSVPQQLIIHKYKCIC